MPFIEIENSAFNDNFFNSVRWGTISEKRYKATRDIFRQLKFYSEQQKNFIDADGFYSLEMKERKKELLEESKAYTKFADKVKHAFSNTMVFYLHEKTSDFSQNWMLPVYWLFILGMIGVIYIKIESQTVVFPLDYFMVTLIICLLSYLAFNNIEEDKVTRKILIYGFITAPILVVYSNVTHNPLDEIAKIINPINIFKSSSGQNVQEISEFIYLIYKIAVLFLVYQVIISIKKKVRSK